MDHTRVKKCKCKRDKQTTTRFTIQLFQSDTMFLFLLEIQQKEVLLISNRTFSVVKEMRENTFAFLHRHKTQMAEKITASKHFNRNGWKNLFFSTLKWLSEITNSFILLKHGIEEPVLDIVDSVVNLNKSIVFYVHWGMFVQYVWFGMQNNTSIIHSSEVKR